MINYDRNEPSVRLDWVTLEKFGELIGYSPRRLYRAKENWPVGQVWQKIDNRLFFSLEGWNEWVNDQAEQNFRRASGLSERPSKLISRSAANGIKRRYHSHKTSPGPRPLPKLEVD